MGTTKMAKSTKITRRIFNQLVAGTAAVFSTSFLQAEESQPTKDCTMYMEILIIPQEFRYPYSHQVREVLYNHIMAGKSKYELKMYILSKAKIIKIPLKPDGVV